jgi:uncharacterized membrane protein
LSIVGWGSNQVLRRRLNTRSRKVFLAAHIISAGMWIGMDVTLGILACTGMLSDDPATVATCFQALVLFAVWPMFTASLATLATGVVLGLGSKYGLVRYWWVAVKLAVNVLMSVLIVFSLRSGLVDAAEFGRQVATTGAVAGSPGRLLFPVFVAPSLLLFAGVLSVFKPWGRIRT